MKKRKITVLFLTFVLCLMSAVTVYADKTNQYDYSYGMNFIDESVAGFTLSRSIDSSYFSVALESVDAVSVGGGRVFIADSISSRINVLDAENYSFVASIKMIRDENNKIVVDANTKEQLVLKNPEGVFMSETLNELYIADTGAERVIVLDAETYALKRIITRPDNMAGDTNFKPSKIAVDHSGRIYIVVANSFEGMIELNPDGQFSRYYGVNTPNINLIDYFWKSIASDNQKQKMAKSFAPSFSNLDIDPEGFVYAATYDTASAKMIFRFNAKGENVIREEGYIPLMGDITMFYVNTNRPSTFTAVSVTDFGVYAVLDKTYGRVFVYDFDGHMITVFSKLGNMKGDLKDPSALAWNGYDLLVGDKALGRVYVYTPTNFGEAALLANDAYFKGDWDTANYYFEEAVKQNANFYTGYAGIGRNYLMEREYEKAVYYFELAGDTAGYSQAYSGYRGEILQKNFSWILLLIAILIGLVIYSEVRYYRKNQF